MTDDPTLLILVEPDERIRTYLTENLVADGYEVAAVATSDDAAALLGTFVPDAVIVSTTPPVDPATVLDAIRACHDGPDVDLPIIAVAASVAAARQWRGRGAVAGLIAKPFGYPELHRMVADRLAARPRARTLGPLTISPDGQVTLRGEQLELSHRELVLLKTLASDPGRVFTKDRLLQDVPAFRQATTRALDSTAVRLRRKLRRTPTDRWIGWVWGVGFTLHDGPVPAA